MHESYIVVIYPGNIGEIVLYSGPYTMKYMIRRMNLLTKDLPLAEIPDES